MRVGVFYCLRQSKLTERRPIKQFIAGLLPTCTILHEIQNLNVYFSSLGKNTDVHLLVPSFIFGQSITVYCTAVYVLGTFALYVGLLVVAFIVEMLCTLVGSSRSLAGEPNSVVLLRGSALCPSHPPVLHVVVHLDGGVLVQPPTQLTHGAVIVEAALEVVTPPKVLIESGVVRVEKLEEVG